MKKVKWNHSRVNSDAQGWAGPGIAKVLESDPKVPGFGIRTEENPKALGPAALIELEHNGLRQMVPIHELEVLPDEGA